MYQVRQNHTERVWAWSSRVCPFSPVPQQIYPHNPEFFLRARLIFYLTLECALGKRVCYIRIQN